MLHQRWQRWPPFFGQVCGVSKVESRVREFSNITRLERVFLYVRALGMGGDGGDSVAHSCHSDSPQLVTLHKKSQQPDFVKWFIYLLLIVVRRCTELAAQDSKSSAHSTTAFARPGARQTRPPGIMTMSSPSRQTWRRQGRRR